MDLDSYRDLQLLTEISSSDSVTQRRLAKRYRLALGLTNFLMRRLVKKGYVKIVNLERKRLRYLITPKGLAEKARLTYDYLEYSLYFYRQIRTLLARALTVIVESGRKETVLYGTSEVAEVAFLMMQQHGVRIVAVVDDASDSQTFFMDQRVRHPQELARCTFDWVVVAVLKDADRVLQDLRRYGVAEKQIIALPDHGAPLDVREGRPAVIAEPLVMNEEARS